MSTPERRPGSPAPGRSAAEIRRDIDAQRQVLGANVESLRGKVTEVTDWRAQVEEHKQQLIIGAAAVGFLVGISAGVFAFLALILVMEGIAWLLNEEVFNGKTWPGFFIEAAVFLLVAALAALIAYKAVKAGSPPVPTQAIEEAKLTKETLSKGDGK